MNKLIGNRYTIKKQLAEGGMGKTFLAVDKKTRKQVVVKILHLKSVKKWKIVELFEREAKTLKNIDHPFIPDYIDYFTESKNGDTEYYLVQEYIAGKNLSQLVAEGKRFSEEHVFDIAEKLFSILVYLQNLQPPVVHRDINPKNIIINDKNDVYLVDFGAVQGAVKSAALGGSTVVGTYGYMPMEQLMGKACTASDIYAAGMTLIYLLSHTNPEDFPIKNMKIMYKNFVKISSRYYTLLDKLIEPDSAGRLPDARSALSLLAKLKQGDMVDADEYAAVIDLHNLLPPFKSKIRFERKGDELAITIPGRVLHSIPLILFSIFWFGFMTFWTTMAIQGFFTMALFSIPFWLAGLFMLGKVINGFSKCVISLTPDIVTIKKGLLLPKKVLPLDRISRVDSQLIQKTDRNRRIGYHHGTLFSLSVAHAIKIEAGAKTVIIDKYLTESEAQWVAQVIQKYRELYA
jgi:serine/threonine protein kinase